MRYTGVLSVVFVSLFASGYAAPMFRQQNQQAPQPVNTDPQSNPQPENNAPQPGTRGGPRIPKAPNPFPALREGNHVNGHGEDYRWRLPGTPKNGDGLLKQPQPQDILGKTVHGAKQGIMYIGDKALGAIGRLPLIGGWAREVQGNLRVKQGAGLVEHAALHGSDSVTKEQHERFPFVDEAAYQYRLQHGQAEAARAASAYRQGGMQADPVARPPTQLVNPDLHGPNNAFNNEIEYVQAGHQGSVVPPSNQNVAVEGVPVRGNDAANPEALKGGTELNSYPPLSRPQQASGQHVPVVTESKERNLDGSARLTEITFKSPGEVPPAI